MSQNILVENGAITLPEDVASRYQIEDSTPMRIIETRGGILLVPLTDTAMDPSLLQEVADWQVLGNETLASFPYESEDQ